MWKVRLAMLLTVLAPLAGFLAEGGGGTGP